MNVRSDEMETVFKVHNIIPFDVVVMWGLPYSRFFSPDIDVFLTQF